VHSSPVVSADGTVYFGSYDRKVYAVHGATGAEKWEFITGGLVLSSPALGPDGIVYIGSGSPDNKLYALQGTSGLAESPWPKFRGNSRNTARASDAIAPVVLLGAKISGLGFRVGVPTRAGKTYHLEFKNSLTENSWTPVASMTGDGTNQGFVDPGPLGAQRFYRVRIE